MKNVGLVLQHLMASGACEPITSPRGQPPQKTFQLRGPYRRDDCLDIAAANGVRKGTKVKLACDPAGPTHTVAKVLDGRVYLRGKFGMSKSFHPRALVVVK